MAKILGIGTTDYPLLEQSDLGMSRSLQSALMSERISDSVRGQGSWPAEMQREWANDMGKQTARHAREAQVEQFRLITKAVEQFDPEVMLILSKDHCETVDRSIYLPYWIYAFDEVTIKPYREDNVFGESPDTEVRIPCAKAFGVQLANRLREDGISPSVLNAPRSAVPLAHTYRSTAVHMDWDQRRPIFPYRMLPMPFNPFGDRLRGVDGLEPMRPEHWLPSTMTQAFALGQAIARVILAGDTRVALVASAGWSHANNTSWDRSWLWPDIEADQQLFGQWKAGKIDRLAELKPDELEEHGWWELWGWAVLAGAMSQAGAKIQHADLQTSYIFNSNWVTTIFEER